ncbi:MAG: hypothetical protein A2Z44_05715 [Betaproteobacteria bacterium RBG_19FT_COMBO_58_11]|nr:MAG: hypothetical protein A2Z44_05715 [Betaproteobacteria bacterium RBG_19FT_COMBO_58_11]
MSMLLDGGADLVHDLIVRNHAARRAIGKACIHRPDNPLRIIVADTVAPAAGKIAGQALAV